MSAFHWRSWLATWPGRGGEVAQRRKRTSSLDGKTGRQDHSFFIPRLHKERLTRVGACFTLYIDAAEPYAESCFHCGVPGNRWGYAVTLFKGCPGATRIREPVPEYIDCPECGQETEIWSHELVGECHLCGAPLYRDVGPLCIDWCTRAKECVGEERYRRLKQRE